MLSKSRRRARSALFLSCSVVAGLLVYRVAFEFITDGTPANSKIRGLSPDCSWTRTILMARDGERMQAHDRLAARSARVVASDERFGIDRIATHHGSFWARRSGREWGGKEMVASLVAGHDWLAEIHPDKLVRPGDVVIDCGAHIGVFTAQALERGASKVIAVEPDPVNLECLRRNMKDFIDRGRVVVVDQGVWSFEGVLTLHQGVTNSGTNSVVVDEGGPRIEISVTTMDRIVTALKLPRVDYIKLDIEGAEREALKGAEATLRKFRPRLSLDGYHRPDDMKILPALILQAHADYRLTCGPCQEAESGSRRLVPHVIYFD